MEAMEAVVRFLPGYAASLVLGFLGGWAHYGYRLWRLRQHAPSATVTTASVALSQQDYDHLARAQRWPGWCARLWPGWCGRKGKLDEHALYLIRNT